MTDFVASDHAEFPFPFDQINIPSEFAARRADCPFGKVELASGHIGRLLVTYQDCRAALGDPRFTHDLTAPGSPRMTPGPSVFDNPDALANMDGERHRRIRRLVAAAFTPRTAARWKPVIGEIAGELIDDLLDAGAPADLMGGFCVPLSGRVMTRLMGVPEADGPQFRRWANAFLSGADLAPDEQLRQIMELAGYTAELLARRRREPGSDLIDELIMARDGEDRLTEEELLLQVLGITVAGYETTANSLSRYVLTLLGDHRRQWELLLADRELVPAAVDELLRITVLGSISAVRVATEDVELPSGTVHAGEAVVIAATSGMRDVREYPDPDEIRFDRDHPATLVFGGGQHICLGMHLAKMELQVGLRVLLERLPGLRLAAAVEELEFTNGEMFSSLCALPVDW